MFIIHRIKVTGWVEWWCQVLFTCHESFRLCVLCSSWVDTFKWWNWVIPYIHTSLFHPFLKDKPILRFMISTDLKCLLVLSFQLFWIQRIQLDSSALSRSALLVLVRYFTGVYLCFLSQASVDPDHEGHSPGHRGETVLGVSSQWQAQTFLHVAEERPTAALRGKLLSSATYQCFILKT